MAKRPNTARVESVLLHRIPCDSTNELESSLFESFKSLQSQLTPPFRLPSQNPSEMGTLTQALTYAILSQPRSSLSMFKHLAVATTDGYAAFVAILIRLVNESYRKLQDQPRTQLLWLVRQLITCSACEVDTLCICLLRCIVGGDLSPGNLWLASQMLDLLYSNFAWVSGNTRLLTIALFTYLRLLSDHFMVKNPSLNGLRQGEVSFCVKILRDHFEACLTIGRDLVRLLQDVALIPEFETIWKDLLSNPAAFHATCFTDISQLYKVRTPSRYITSRLTVEMEAQVRFLLMNVRMGNQMRYQGWFARHFLSTPGSDSLVWDLIRFICCSHHPTNQILQSDIVPRWAIVGWLLTCCRSHHVEANAKLALFYDWLFFACKSDNIMNVEPALLLMVHSIPKYMDMTHSLLDFLFLCIEHYDVSRKDLIRQGVIASMDVLVEKGVILSLETLSSNNLVAPSLREKLVSYFPAYCKPMGRQDKPRVAVGIEKSENQANYQQSITSIANVSLVSSADPIIDLPRCKKRRLTVEMTEDLVTKFTKAGMEHVDTMEKVLGLALGGRLSSNESAVDEAIDTDITTSDREDVLNFSNRLLDALKERGFNVFHPLCGYSADKLEVDEVSSLTSVVIRKYIESHDPLLLIVLLSWHVRGLSVGARFLCYVARLGEGLSRKMDEVQHWQDLNTGMPIVHHEMPFSDFPILKDDQSRTKMQVFCQSRTDTAGFCALCWHLRICHSEVHDERKAGIHDRTCIEQSVTDSYLAYEEFLKGVVKLRLKSGEPILSGGCLADDGRVQEVEEERTSVSLLVKDLETCLIWNVNRLLAVLPSVFHYLPKLSRGREEIVKLLVSVVGPPELLALELELSLNEVLVFGHEVGSIKKLLESSLRWDCFEQQYMWRLLCAEMQNTVPLFVVGLLKECSYFLKPSLHFEALSGLLLLLKLQPVTTHLAMQLLVLPEEFHKLVAALFSSWLFKDAAKVFDCLDSLNLKDKQALCTINAYAFNNLLLLLESFLRKNNKIDEKAKAHVFLIKSMLLGLLENPIP